MELNIADDDFDPPEDIKELNYMAEELASVGIVIQEWEQVVEVERLDRQEEEQQERARVEADLEREREERERVAAEIINEDRRQKGVVRQEKALKRIQD